MMQMLAIALNTFREAIRNRLFAAMLLMTVGMLIVVAAFSSASRSGPTALKRVPRLLLITVGT